MSIFSPHLGAPAPETPPLRRIAARLWLILGGLRHVVAALGGRDRAAVPLVVLTWNRLGRLGTRFEALVAHLAAGTLPAPRPAGLGRTRKASPAAASVRLPGGFGWLGQMLPEARVYGSQLEAMLHDPATMALLAACPRAGRVIRPLRRMLGVAEPGVPVRAQAAKPMAARWHIVPALPEPTPSGPAESLPGRLPPWCPS